MQSLQAYPERALGFGPSTTTLHGQPRSHVYELLPSIGELSAQRTWSGSKPFSLDGRPLLGPVPDRPGLFLAAGLAVEWIRTGPDS